MVQTGTNKYLYGYSTASGAPQVNVWGAGELKGSVARFTNQHLRSVLKVGHISVPYAVLMGASVIAVGLYLFITHLRKALAAW